MHSKVCYVYHVYLSGCSAVSGRLGAGSETVEGGRREKLSADELVTMKSLLSKQLVDGVVALLAEIPLL